MNGFEYICGGISLFEESLETTDGEPPIRTVSELARRTGYSVYHFTRLFTAVTGNSPKEYLSSRILTEAAKKIAGTDRPLAAIADDAGYPDYESFSRAFKKRFGLPPKRIRDLHYIPFECTEKIIPKESAGTLNLAVREPEIVKIDGHNLTGLAFFIEEGTPSFHKQWATFMAVQARVQGRTEGETFCQYSSWSDEETLGGMSVLCALETERSAKQEPLFTTKEVPAASYLRFLHTADISAIAHTYEYIYRDWFAHNDIKPLDFWEFQRYTDGGRTTGIYIPVALG